LVTFLIPFRFRNLPRAKNRVFTVIFYARNINIRTFATPKIEVPLSLHHPSF